MKFDFLIVGAGLTGCVFAERISSQLNKSVLLIDGRDHIGGNVYDYYNDQGLLIHKYGPHWFHTNDDAVFQYLSLFTQWRFHIHKVRSMVDGMLLPFPINRDTINLLYHKNYSSEEEVEAFFEDVRDKSIGYARNAEEMIVSKIGWDLYEKFYKNYTVKQWDIDPKNLAASVTSRIPIRTNCYDGYFSDRYQGVPLEGYTKMLSRMIDNDRITVQLNTEHRKVAESIQFEKMIFTGSMDDFFDYRHGLLPYRSIRFEHDVLAQERYQPFQQVNYPNSHAFTRITEWKHATGQQHNHTAITKEFPFQATCTGERYYPIPTPENDKIYALYCKEAAKVTNCIFCGRLADYKYYNMDQVVARALKIFRTHCH
jgi:UDP-galactopyranose mutase